MKSSNAARVFRRSDAYVLAAPGVTQLVDGAVRLVDCDVEQGG